MKTEGIRYKVRFFVCYALFDLKFFFLKVIFSEIDFF